jgi:hypothetical protein
MIQEMRAPVKITDVELSRPLEPIEGLRGYNAVRALEHQLIEGVQC